MIILVFPERSDSDGTSCSVCERDGDQTGEELHPEMSRLLQVSQSDEEGSSSGEEDQNTAAPLHPSIIAVKDTNV